MLTGLFFCARCQICRCPYEVTKAMTNRGRGSVVCPVPHYQSIGSKLSPQAGSRSIPLVVCVPAEISFQSQLALRGRQGACQCLWKLLLSVYSHLAIPQTYTNSYFVNYFASTPLGQVDENGSHFTKEIGLKN